ncbi:hypothetical protein [Pseudomonas viridiflava]|uniref:hypothetical protein n=1 Tax=Pseudomonas viridiflava TaxID=33069 RepID=UPI000C06D121|nr:hypothetical protein [Pseudomonas viridiflava]
MYHYIEPEVAGGLGEGTIINTSCHPPKIEKLEYRFDAWLGDDILETFPCYIVTTELAKAIKLNKLTGVSFLPVKISKSEFFLETYPDLELPQFQWMSVYGEAGTHDFGLSKNYRLAISYSAMSTLKNFKISHAEILACN